MAEQRFREARLCYGHGTDNPYDEAVYLVLRALGLPMDVADTILDTSLTYNSQQYVIGLLEKRIALRIPVAYLVNEAWFCGLPFYVDEHVLIPRSPIAELIEARFAPWVLEKNITRVLDIGTGSGCIAIACAYAFPGASIDAVDISDEVLQVAARNIEQHEKNDRIRLINSDIYSNLTNQHYDLIVANPPYVSVEELSRLPEEYTHEPVTALEAGQDGLDVVRKLLSESGLHIKNDGILVVEVGNSQPAVMDAYPDLPFVWLEFEHGGAGVFLLTADNL